MLMLLPCASAATLVIVMVRLQSHKPQDTTPLLSTRWLIARHIASSASPQVHGFHGTGIRYTFVPSLERHNLSRLSKNMQISKFFGALEHQWIQDNLHFVRAMDDLCTGCGQTTQQRILFCSWICVLLGGELLKFTCMVV